MRREIASEITTVTKKIDTLWNDLDLIINKIDDESEKKKLKRALFNLVIDMHEKITLEATRDFPEFHPDGDAQLRGGRIWNGGRSK